VDKFGSAVASGPADQATVADTRVIKAYLGRFVTDWRSLTTDRVAQKDAVMRVYALLSLGSAGHKKMNEYFESNNPFVRLQQGTTSVEVTTALPISDKTWQVEWTEISRNFKGEVESKLRYKASLIVGNKPPTQESQIMVNPLGVFVTDFNFAQQL
jgi:type IV secretory pathway TrbF-like protein